MRGKPQKKQRATPAIDATRGTPLKMVSVRFRTGTSPARNFSDY
jgi:hypothetical protein